MSHTEEFKGELKLSGQSQSAAAASQTPEEELALKENNSDTQIAKLDSFDEKLASANAISLAGNSDEETSSSSSISGKQEVIDEG